MQRLFTSVYLQQILTLQSREWKTIPPGTVPSPAAQPAPSRVNSKAVLKLRLICFTYLSPAQLWFPSPASFSPSADSLTPQHVLQN